MQRSSHGQISMVLIQSAKTDHVGHWYSLGAIGMTAVLTNATSDFTWSVLSSLNLDYRFRPSDNLLHQALGQQLGTSLAVITATPIISFICSKYYKEDFKKCFTYSSIAAIATLVTILPFDYMAEVGQTFFTSLGFNETAANYLSSVFPGPGLPDGILETLVTTGLSALLLPNFKFNPLAFALALTPIAYISGDAWLAMFLAFSDIAKQNAGGVVAQGLMVMLTTLVLNYATSKSIILVDDVFQNSQLKKHLIEFLKKTGSPFHRELPVSIDPAPAAALAELAANPIV